MIWTEVRTEIPAVNYDLHMLSAVLTLLVTLIFSRSMFGQPQVTDQNLGKIKIKSSFSFYVSCEIIIIIFF